ncbi:MAG: hypothetical protein EBV83_07980 [Verrucomicrobia bacterium]|nr:hypothetical protein [Verrucomicrobiota bacterium]
MRLSWGMVRRAHRQASPSLWLILAAVFVALGALGAFLFQKDGNPYRTVEPLKPADYLENANSLKGNTYQLEGVIASSLGSSPEKGRLFSFRASYGDKEWPLPVLVPPGYRDLNLQKGQRYRLKVRVNGAGLIEIEEMTKS